MTIMGGSASDAAAQIIDAHQCRPRSRCACGVSTAPSGHTAHVLHQLQLAGIDVVWR